MEAAVSLFWIALVAVASPLLSALVPRRLVPETVLLLAFGVVIGPHALGIATMGEAVDAFRELGLGMLFLLAGYEIELKELTGRGGRRALVTWVCCFLLALGFVGLLGLSGLVTAEIAVAIALVSTALGVLLPILRDSGQLSTPFGATILNHGAFGSSVRSSPWRCSSTRAVRSSRSSSSGSSPSWPSASRMRRRPCCRAAACTG